MTKRQYKVKANDGYMKYYIQARSFKYVENRCKASLMLTGYLDGVRQMAVEDDEISADEFVEVLDYCRMLDERFVERFDL